MIGTSRYFLLKSMLNDGRNEGRKEKLSEIREKRASETDVATLADFTNNWDVFRENVVRRTCQCDLRNVMTTLDEKGDMRFICLLDCVREIA